MNLIISTSLLGVNVVGYEEVEDGEPDVVEEDEERTHLEDSDPNVANLLTNPLRVIEVSDLEA